MREAGEPLAGAFIVVEGTDGSGTTTQRDLLGRALAARNVPVTATNEPSGGPVGKLIRQLLVTGASDPYLDWTTMALLFAADRADHVARTVRPALERGELVVSDRYDLSSMIYQSLTARSDADALPWIRELNCHALRPDLTLVIDVSPATALARRRARGGTEEVYEAAPLQERLAAAYLDAERFLPGDRIVHVDGSGSVDAVARAILAAVEAALPGLPVRGPA